MIELRGARAALRGNPSFVWRAGQERRLRMILELGAGASATRAGERVRRGRLPAGAAGVRPRGVRDRH